jgi:hypothetical protein
MSHQRIQTKARLTAAGLWAWETRVMVQLGAPERAAGHAGQGDYWRPAESSTWASQRQAVQQASYADKYAGG